MNTLRWINLYIFAHTHTRARTINTFFFISARDMYFIIYSSTFNSMFNFSFARTLLLFRCSTKERMINVCDAYLLDRLLTRWLTRYLTPPHKFGLTQVYRLLTTQCTTLKMKQQTPSIFFPLSKKKKMKENKTKQNAWRCDFCDSLA